MPQIVRQRDRLGQIFVQGQRPRDRPADRRHLDRMREPRPQMIAGPVQENLRLIFQAAKGARMNDPRAVALKLRPIDVPRLRIFPAARFAGLLRKRRQDTRFVRFHLLAGLPTIPMAVAASRIICHEPIIRSPPLLCQPGVPAFYLANPRRPFIVFASPTQNVPSSETTSQGNTRSRRRRE